MGMEKWGGRFNVMIVVEMSSISNLITVFDFDYDVH